MEERQSECKDDSENAEINALLENQIDMPIEFSEIIDDNFWDLV